MTYTKGYHATFSIKPQSKKTQESAVILLSVERDECGVSFHVY